jgi:hypothetical protein
MRCFLNYSPATTLHQTLRRLSFAGVTLLHPTFKCRPCGGASLMVRCMQKVNKPSMRARKTLWKAQGCGTNTEILIVVSLLARGAHSSAIRDLELIVYQVLRVADKGQGQTSPLHETWRWEGDAYGWTLSRHRYASSLTSRHCPPAMLTARRRNQSELRFCYNYNKRQHIT